MEFNYTQDLEVKYKFMIILRAMLIVQFSSEPMEEETKHRSQESGASETDKTNMILEHDLYIQQL